MGPRYKNKPPTRNEKICWGTLGGVVIVLGIWLGVSIIQTNFENRYLIEFSSPDMEHLEIYRSMYYSPSSLTKPVYPVNNLTHTFCDMRDAYQVLVYEKIIFANGTFSLYKHERFIFDYMSLSENDNKAVIPLINTNLTISII